MKPRRTYRGSRSRKPSIQALEREFFDLNGERLGLRIGDQFCHIHITKPDERAATVELLRANAEELEALGARGVRNVKDSALILVWHAEKQASIQILDAIAQGCPFPLIEPMIERAFVPLRDALRRIGVFP